MLATALLVALLSAVVWIFWDDKAEYERFKALTRTADRQARFRVWVLKAFALFTVGSFIVLASIGRFDALTVFPPEFTGLLPDDFGSDGGERESGFRFAALIAGGSLGGGLIGGFIASRRKKTPGKSVMLGDVEPLLPRNRGERLWAALLSLNAGLGEELFFRLVLPLLIALVTGWPMAAFIAVIVLFGAVHFYQGLAGVFGTMAMGAVMTLIYLATQSIWLPVLLHAAIDLNGLILMPLLFRRGAATPE